MTADRTASSGGIGPPELFLQFDYEPAPAPPTPTRRWRWAKALFKKTYWHTVSLGRLF